MALLKDAVEPRAQGSVVVIPDVEFLLAGHIGRFPLDPYELCFSQLLKTPDRLIYERPCRARFGALEPLPFWLKC